jgi:glycosyltransferase involved in cell wall biosynthesis
MLMKPDLFFTVITPTYNRADFIKKSVESILQQTHKNFEIIIVNDGSTDNTLEVLSVYSDPRISIITIHNSERGAARNRGIEKAKGDYITFLDSDDIYYNNYLSNAATQLLAQNQPPFYHQAYEIKNQKGKLLNFDINYGDGIYFLVKGNPLSCIGVFIRKDITEKFRFIEDRNLSGSEDWELWIRLGVNFGLAKDKTVTSCLIVHDERSVLNVNKEKLALRKNLLIHYAFQDEKVQKVFGKYKNRMKAYSETYIALHLILEDEISAGIKYLFSAFKKYPPSIIDIRTLGIFKQLAISIGRKFNRTKA